MTVVGQAWGRRGQSLMRTLQPDHIEALTALNQGGGGVATSLSHH